MKAILLLLLLIVSACSVQEPLQEDLQAEEPAIIAKVNEEASFISEEKIAEAKVDTRNGVQSTLTGIYRRIENDKPILIFKLESENLKQEPMNPDPKLWRAYIYFAKKVVTPLFLCDFGSEGQSWFADYCVDEAKLDKNYFNQGIWIIYTREVDEPRIYDQTILDIARFDDTHIYKMVIPKE